MAPNGRALTHLRLQAGAGPPRTCCSCPPRALSRGQVLRSVIALPPGILAAFLVSQSLPAAAFTLEDVTPPVAPVRPMRDSELAIIDLFERNTRSVVNVFDLSLQGRGVAPGQAVDVPEGNGSGFVWSKAGHIVTNYHVLGNSLKNLGPDAATKGNVKVARVTLLDQDGLKRDYIGTLVGQLRSKDLAVIKIEAARDLLQPVTLGSSAAVRVGQQCVAIGNPFGFDHTLSVGSISGLGRTIQSQAGAAYAEMTLHESGL
jgi:S1-C subfamily serine protease